MLISVRSGCHGTKGSTARPDHPRMLHSSRKYKQAGRQLSHRAWVAHPGAEPSLGFAACPTATLGLLLNLQQRGVGERPRTSRGAQAPAVRLWIRRAITSQLLNWCSASTAPRSGDSRSYSHPVTQHFAAPLGPQTPGVKPAGLPVPAQLLCHLRGQTRPLMAFIRVFGADRRTCAGINRSRYCPGRSGCFSLLQPGSGGVKGSTWDHPAMNSPIANPS